MGTIITDLKDRFRRGNTCVRLIFINTGVFLLIELMRILLLLFNVNPSIVTGRLELPASPLRLLWQPWSLLTYMFLHAGLLHLLFNMLWLYWFGSLFLTRFSARHLRGVYLLGGLCGGLLYLLAYNLFPFFQPYVAGTTMVGASAAVLAIVVAIACREPDYPLQLLLIGTVRLKYLALAVVVIDLLFVTSGNGGGHIAHLGGALAGWWFAASLAKGRDVTAWINRACDGVASLFVRRPRQPKMKVHRASGSREQDYAYNARKKAQSDEIDRILDKLRKSGYESLTTEEKQRLFDAGKQ